jgi:hypothetical protein
MNIEFWLQKWIQERTIDIASGGSQPQLFITIVRMLLFGHQCRPTTSEPQGWAYILLFQSFPQDSKVQQGLRTTEKVLDQSKLLCTTKHLWSLTIME